MNNLNWIIIGAGELGREFYNIFFKNTNKELSYFVDDDKSKKFLYGKKVINFDDLFKSKKK
jgi:hypothetical protein